MLTIPGCLYTKSSLPKPDAKVAIQQDQRQDSTHKLQNNREKEVDITPNNNNVKKDSNTLFNSDDQKNNLAAEYTDRDEHLKNGIQLYAEGHFKEAIAELKIAIQIRMINSRNISDAYGYMALCIFGMDQNDVYNIKEYLKRAIMSDTSWEPNENDYNPIICSIFEEVKADIAKSNIPMRSWLGIQLMDISNNADIAKKYIIAKEYGRKTYEGKGILVMEVCNDSPAEKAGIQQGDLIIECNGNLLKDSSQLRKLISTTKPDEIVNIKIARSYEVIEFEIPIIKKTDEEIDKAYWHKKFKWLGITVMEINEELARKLGYDSHYGVLITDIANNSPAVKCGIRSLDMISIVNFISVSDLQDFKESIEIYKHYDYMSLQIRRSITEKLLVGFSLR